MAHVTLFEVDRKVRCQKCARAFHWSEARLVPISEDEDQGIQPKGPGCPKCCALVSMRQLKFDEKARRRTAREASRMAKAGMRPAVAGVWGGTGGLMRPLAFPAIFSDRRMGELFDEALVEQGWPEARGPTWIRTAFWDEAKALGSTDGDSRIMVHWDGRALSRSAVWDWITVVPEGLEGIDE